MAGKPAVTSSDICLWLLSAPLVLASCCTYSNYRLIDCFAICHSHGRGHSTDPSIPCLQVVVLGEAWAGPSGKGWAGVSMRLSELTEANFPPCKGKRLHNAPDKLRLNTSVSKQYPGTAQAAAVSFPELSRKWVIYKLSELASEWPRHTAVTARDGWGLCSQYLLRNNQQGHLRLLWALPLYGWELPRPELASCLFKAERAAEGLGRKIVFIGVAWYNTRFSVFSDLENQALPVHFSSPRVTPKAKPTVAPLVDVLYKANTQQGHWPAGCSWFYPEAQGLLNVRISTLSSLHVYWRES